MLACLSELDNDIYRDVVDRLFHQADVNMKAKQASDFLFAPIVEG